MKHINIIFYFTVLIFVVGCQTTHESILNPLPNKIITNYLDLFYIEHDTTISAVIRNISNEDLFVHISRFGIGFDLEYTTTNGENKWLNGMFENISPEFYTLYFIKPVVNLPKENNVKRIVIGENSTLHVTLNKPTDFLRMRRLECCVKYLSILNFRDIENTEMFFNKLHGNYVYLRYVAPKLVPGIDVYDTNFIGLSNYPTIPLKSNLRGYINSFNNNSD